jgi:hypothetical protein
MRPSQRAASSGRRHRAQALMSELKAMALGATPARPMRRSHAAAPSTSRAAPNALMTEL